MRYGMKASKRKHEQKMSKWEKKLADGKQQQKIRATFRRIFFRNKK